METTLRLDRLRIDRKRRSRLRERAWREWCFWRAAIAQLWLRLAVLTALLVFGAVMFRLYEPERNHSFIQAAYYTWSLIFGEPPEEFPRSMALRVMFFVVPVIGLVVIIEGIVELALMVRDRRRNERAWCRIMCKSMKNHIIIVGLGRLGYRTFLLLRKLGEDVVVIENNPNNQFLEDIRRDGSPLLLGDARREALLVEANVAQARSVILATTDDLANLEIALDARRINGKIRVVTRMFDQNMADKVRDGFNIHIAMSQASLSAPSFAMRAVQPGIVNSIIVDDRLVITRRWLVRDGGPLCGLTVGELMHSHRCGVLERASRGGLRELFPSPETRLEPGDGLLIQGVYEELAALVQSVDESSVAID